VTQIKISALPAATALAPGDLLPLVDVSDISQAATGTTKKLTVAEIIAGNVAMLPSGDTTGVADDAALAAAIAALPAGGTIWLAPGDFYTAAGWVPPAQTTAGTTGGNPVCLQGSGATNLRLGSAASGPVTFIYYHRTSLYGSTQTNNQPAGFVRDIYIDGTGAAAGSVGLDMGDGENHSCSGITINNFTADYCVGFRQNNAVGWTEKCRFQVTVFHCAIAATIDCAGSSRTSHEYNTFDIMMMQFLDGQQGLIVQGGAATGGCAINLHGNMQAGTATTQGAFAYTSSAATSRFTLPGGTALANGTPVILTGPGTGGFTNSQVYFTLAASANTVQLSETPGGTPVTVTVGGSGTMTTAVSALLVTGQLAGEFSTVQKCSLRMKVESAAGAVAANAVTLGSAANAIQHVEGRICHSLGDSVLNGGEFTFRGLIEGDAGLSQAYPGAASGTTQTTQPAFPGSGTPKYNYGPDFTVCVAGGTVTAISVSGVATGLTAGAFLVPAGGYITVTGTPASYLWVPATQTQY
jgi:hypothetical protein